MTKLLFGIALFALPHLFSMLLPAARDRLKSRLGEGPWKGLYSLVSLAGLALMIWGFVAARAAPGGGEVLYAPAAGARHLTMLLVLLGFVLLGASHGKGYLKLWLRHPMSIGVGLWAAGHLLANGERAAVYLFGTFLALAVADIALSSLRGKIPAHQPRLRSDIVAAIVGMALYAVFLFGFHPYVLELPVAG